MRDFMREMRGFKDQTIRLLGVLEKGQASLENHISAVSQKANSIRSEIVDHAKEQNAHGLGGERRASMSISNWIGIGLSVVSGLIAAYAVMGGRHG